MSVIYVRDMAHIIEKSKFLIKSTRPKLNFGLFLGVLMGLVYSNSLSFENVLISSLIMFFHGFAVFSLNDYFDRDTDQYQDERYLKGILDKKKDPILLYASIISILSILAIGLMAPGKVFLPVLVVIIFAIFYSVPPIRLKSKPFIDSFSNGIWVLGLFSIGIALGKDSILIPNKAYWMSAFLAGAHALASLPDIEADRNAGIKTTGMILGWRKTVLAEISLILLSFILVKWGAVTSALFSLFLFYLIYILAYPDKEHFYRGLKFMLPVAIAYGSLWLIVSV